MGSLIVGALFYLLARGWGDVYFISIVAESKSAIINPPAESVLWGAFPTFIHTFSMILILVGILSLQGREILAASLLWVGVEVLFEFMQMPSLAEEVVNLVPDWFSNYLLLENIAPYFTKGTFDWIDLISILVAAMAAGYLSHRLAT